MGVLPNWAYMNFLLFYIPFFRDLWGINAKFFCIYPFVEKITVFLSGLRYEKDLKVNFFPIYPK